MCPIMFLSATFDHLAAQEASYSCQCHKPPASTTSATCELNSALEKADIHNILRQRLNQRSPAQTIEPAPSNELSVSTSSVLAEDISIQVCPLDDVLVELAAAYESEARFFSKAGAFFGPENGVGGKLSLANTFNRKLGGTVDSNDSNNDNDSDSDSDDGEADDGSPTGPMRKAPALRLLGASLKSTATRPSRGSASSVSTRLSVNMTPTRPSRGTSSARPALAFAAAFDSDEDEAEVDDDILVATPTRTSPLFSTPPRSARNVCKVALPPCQHASASPAVNTVVESVATIKTTPQRPAVIFVPEVPGIVIVASTPAKTFEVKQQAGLVSVFESVSDDAIPYKRMRPSMMALETCWLKNVDEGNVVEAVFGSVNVALGACYVEDEQDGEKHTAADWDHQQVDIGNDNDEFGFDWTTTVDDLEAGWLARRHAVAFVRKPCIGRFARVQLSMFAFSFLKNVAEEVEQPEVERAVELEVEQAAVVYGLSHRVTQVADSIETEIKMADCDVVIASSETASVICPSSVVLQDGQTSIPSASPAAVSLQTKVKTFVKRLSPRKSRSSLPLTVACTVVSVDDPEEEDDEDSAEAFGRWCAAAAVASSSTPTVPAHRSSASSFLSFDSGSAVSTSASSWGEDDRAPCTPPPSNGSKAGSVSQSTSGLTWDSLVFRSASSLNQSASPATANGRKTRSPLAFPFRPAELDPALMKPSLLRRLA